LLDRELARRLQNDGFVPAHPAAAGARTEWEYAGLRLRVLSASKAARYVTSTGDEVAISIGDRGAAAVILSPDFVDVLHLEFDDVAEATALARRGSVRPRASLDQEGAAQIARFVWRHRHRSALLLHCSGGVSRSRSVAAAVAEVLGLPYTWTIANPAVHQLVRDALERERLAG
jgi:predicted protein tyrosine phosphatase